MNTHLHARGRRRPVTVAVSIAGLAFLSASCASSSTLAAGSASPSPAPTGPATTALSTASPPVTTTAPPATAPPATAPADAHIKVYGNCTTPTVEPNEIVLACADYGTLLEGLRWTSWTATTATATGTLEYNDCLPSCVAGHHHNIPGTRVTLTLPVSRDGGPLLWSRVQESPQPPGYATGPYHGGPQPLPLGPV
jgi:hypothetical protein